MTERPIVKCLVARPLSNGHIGRSRLVSLSTALLALRAGWHVVGPDPDDLVRLAEWERENQPPFNAPRVP
jgi:hypothetical protein